MLMRAEAEAPSRRRKRGPRRMGTGFMARLWPQGIVPESARVSRGCLAHRSRIRLSAVVNRSVASACNSIVRPRRAVTGQWQRMVLFRKPRSAVRLRVLRAAGAGADRPFRAIEGVLIDPQPSAPDASRSARPFRGEGPFVTVPGRPVLALVRGGGVSQPFEDVRKRPLAHIEVR